MQSLVEIADEFTALMAAGDLQVAAQKYWAQDISCLLYTSDAADE